MSSKTVYILSGLPCTGKTQIRYELLKQHKDSFVYSTDDYIENKAKELNLTYSEIFRDYIDEATVEMNRQLQLAVENGCNTIIWDQTNLTQSKRDFIITKINLLNKSSEPYKVEYYSIAIPSMIEEWIRFAMYSRQGKKLSEKTLRSMLIRYQVPGINTDESSVTRFIPVWRQ